jgi:hypothetical protein
MTEPEDFLTRWSRRKRDAKVESEAATKSDAEQQSRERAVASDAETQSAQQVSVPAGESAPEKVFDLSKLPSLDSIGPATDIRVFLQPGVPEALSRAALRRAWAADPGIRDFVGLAENSWDFTASDGMHGFGALDPADAKRLIAQLLSGDDNRDAPAATAAAETQDRSGDVELEGSAAAEAIPAATGDAAGPSREAMASGADEAMKIGGDVSSDGASQDNIAMQNNQTEPQGRRIHGRALPQ